jgi:hypothetical protein
MTAVAAIVLNRVRAGQPARFGSTIEEVCKKPMQFSCWNPGTDPNHLAMPLSGPALLWLAPDGGMAGLFYRAGASLLGS